MKLVDNPKLKEHILKRLYEIDWKDIDLIKDAEERGIKIEANRWTKYKKGKSGAITDETLVWIATRLGIDINLRFGKPIFDGEKITWTISKYDELQCILKIQQLYPKTVK